MYKYFSISKHAMLKCITVIKISFQLVSLKTTIKIFLTQNENHLIIVTYNLNQINLWSYLFIYQKTDLPGSNQMKIKSEGCYIEGNN